MRRGTVVIIGSGNVAGALCRWIPRAGYSVAQVFARNVESGTRLAQAAGCAYESDPSRLAPADIYIISVSDKAVAEVCKTLDFGDSVVVHTSGGCGIDCLSPSAKNRGVIYPLQTFSAGCDLNFREIPLFIEASDEATLARIGELARAMSDSVRECNSEQRCKLHVAAVFACNFVNRLYCTADALMRENGFDFSLLKPLIGETARKAMQSDSPQSLQTGPAARKDWNTIARHLEILKNNPQLTEIYKLLTINIIHGNNG